MAGFVIVGVCATIVDDLHWAVGGQTRAQTPEHLSSGTGPGSAAIQGPPHGG